MVLEANSTSAKPSSATAETAEINPRLLSGTGGRMPYVFVRENAIKYWCTIQVGDSLNSGPSITTQIYL